MMWSWAKQSSYQLDCKQNARSGAIDSKLCLCPEYGSTGYQEASFGFLEKIQLGSYRALLAKLASEAGPC